ncbi:MAG: ABC transporter permease [Caldisericia bacterium]
MKKFLILFNKEIKNLITIQLILPLIIMVLLFSFLGSVITKQVKKEQEPKKIAVVDYDQTFLSNDVINTLQSGNFIVDKISLSKEEALDYAKKNNISTLVIIPSGFQDNVTRFFQNEIEVYSIMKGISFTNISSSISTQIILANINEIISNRYISEKFLGMNPNIIKNPVKIKSYVVVKDKMANTTVETISSAISSQNIFIPIILMIVIIFSSQMIASTIASEKENKTLETLLTMPINRTSIIFSKMLSSGVVALLMSVVYMIGMRNYMSGITGGITSGTQVTSDISKILVELGLTFNAQSYILLGISLFFAILCALSLSMILAVFAENVQSAQTLLTPIMVLLLIPYFLSLFMDLNSLPLIVKILLFIIPFSHPFMASQNLIFGNTLPIIYGIIYMAIFFVICLIIATKIFSSDRILTARIKIKKGFLKIR